MDDLPFHCNKSTIYVLNTNYNYGDLGGLNTDFTSRPIYSYESSNHLVSNKIGNAENHSTSSGSSCGVAALANFFPCSNAFGYLQHQDHQKNKFFNFQHGHQIQHQHQPQLNNHSQKSLITRQNKDQQKNLYISPATATLLAQNKKFPTIKPTIIAKKTKFWKFLEEEKWKKNSVESFPKERISSSSGNSEKGSELAKGHLNLHIRNDTSSTSDSETITTPTTTSSLLNCDNNNNYNANESKHSCCNISNNGKQNTGTSSNITTSNSNSTLELYREAVQLLGLSCTLCDNCRCIDCQSRYFECDDDFDCDDSLEDCLDTFGHFDGGSFNIEPEQTFDIREIYNAVQVNRNQS
ncbi:probable cyclin-dependent serine/threonine-protein kinase DDB_G0292550 [Condylostylus longicornis]|uniref:probable cyclin-dependent serine/threonine-protein kinase DDB_G0292550 n=1 Tax=Condylostylus longicornis TaxID=2530218 RepID=UPI00244E2CDB|nr:probable cyclin-dependent serine/threonine-protein kinase DDB_G0292550 [Condylostylus longicornis]